MLVDLFPRLFRNSMNPFVNVYKNAPSIALVKVIFAFLRLYHLPQFDRGVLVIPSDRFRIRVIFDYWVGGRREFETAFASRDRKFLQRHHTK